jgi:AraC-like DNA-binding protein
MLLARGNTALGGAALRWAFVFARNISSIVVERRGLVFDARYLPAAKGAPGSGVCLYLLLRGSWQVHGEPLGFEGPSAFVVAPHVLEGSRGRRAYAFRAVGEPFQAVQLYLRPSDISIEGSERPVPVAIDEDILDSAMRAASLGHASDDDIIGGIVDVLRGLERSGIVRTKVVDTAMDPTPFARLWAAIRPMAEKFVLSPTLQQMGDLAGLSSRQLERHLQGFFTTFGFVGSGWRTATRHLRLKLAVLFLSAEDVTIGDVSIAVGYGSTDAMARAFRDADLPAPSVVQAALRAR